jgi:hypothetical protein
MPVLKLVICCTLVMALASAGCRISPPPPPREEISLEDPPAPPVGPPSWFTPETAYQPWPLGDEPEHGTEAWRRWCALRYHSRDLVREADQAPTIDGALTEPLWPRATLRQPFLGTDGRAANPATQVSIAYDRTHLYIAARMVEPMVGKLRASARERDASMAGDDHIEIHLSRSEPRTRSGDFQFRVNSAGTLVDARHLDPGWDAEIQVAARTGPGDWTFEMAIPLKALDVMPGLDLSGELWACRLIRWRRAGGQTEVSSWTRLIDPDTGGSHWGHLMFKGPKAASEKPADGADTGAKPQE